MRTGVPVTTRRPNATTATRTITPRAVITASPPNGRPVSEPSTPPARSMSTCAVGEPNPRWNSPTIPARTQIQPIARRPKASGSPAERKSRNRYPHIYHILFF